VLGKTTPLRTAEAQYLTVNHGAGKLAVEAEFAKLYANSVELAHNTTALHHRRKKDSDYSASDESSWAGFNADDHARRVPVFAAAQAFGEGQLVTVVKNTIAAALAKCNDPAADKYYCEKAIRCVALNSVTHHWKKLHLFDKECHNIINQFNNGRNLKNFNPLDQNMLRTMWQTLQPLALNQVALGRVKYRIVCEKFQHHHKNHDFVCNQKVDCYLSVGLANAFADVVRIARCPYKGFQLYDEEDDDDNHGDPEDYFVANVSQFVPYVNALPPQNLAGGNPGQDGDAAALFDSEELSQQRRQRKGHHNNDDE